MPNFNLIDTPGLNDARIPTADWVGRFNRSDAAKPQPIALLVLLFKASNRPTVGDENILGVWRAALENINAQNCAIIFTHCDEDAELDIEYAE